MIIKTRQREYQPNFEQDVKYYQRNYNSIDVMSKTMNLINKHFITKWLNSSC